MVSMQRKTPADALAAKRAKADESNTHISTDGSSAEFEFGGSFGAALLMTSFPLLMWYMWIGAYPTAKGWAIYWIFFILEAAMYCYMPGVSSVGRALKHEGGKTLPYYCSAYCSFYATLTIAAVLHFTRAFPLYTLIDEFGSIMSVATLSGFLDSFIVYMQAILRGRTHRLSGSPVYDFLMGAELNPRIGILDFKMFYEVRIPWFILFLITCSVAARQYEIYGYVSAEVAEQMIITSWNMYFEKLGFLLTFWNMAGVPFTYCHCALYLANHDPSEYRWNRYSLSAFAVLYIFFYWVWDSSNGQRNAFRHQEKGQLIKRNTFPQVLWQAIKNPKVIETDTGDNTKAKLLRESPFPWFYFIFFMIMIIHRTNRDINRCQRKNGEARKRYEREVPYLFIPVSLQMANPEVKTANIFFLSM
ncbi:ergosterol biosynthesis ERG4/ERG24 family-domain-containing protein [Aspergillus flavus]|uniref:Delta(24(24(1)))-sterol reductase n=1 Tax=Aspergillus flavus TaxID=5059 RepID=A0A5N6GR07_ASPFL|nr:ergosterol biosynthesis ERG4/ERG24 family-domain-containing protein [Aspergillus flavus]